MRIWYQLLSSERRLSNFLKGAQSLCDKVAAPGTTVEVRGTRHGALGDQYRFFWHYDVREVVDNGLKVRDETRASGKYDAFVVANSLDPAIVELREMLDIPVLSFMEVNCFTACMLGDRFGLVPRAGPQAVPHSSPSTTGPTNRPIRPPEIVPQITPARITAIGVCRPRAIKTGRSTLSSSRSGAV